MAQELILVIEDDDDIASSIELILLDAGYTVAVASNGRVALEQLARISPRLILLDMNMPVMNGWQFIAAYRQGPLRPVPLIAMTAAFHTDQNMRTIDADAVIAKPLEVQQLLTLITAFIAATGPS